MSAGVYSTALRVATEWKSGSRALESGFQQAVIGWAGGACGAAKKFFVAERALIDDKHPAIHTSIRAGNLGRIDFLFQRSGCAGRFSRSVKSRPGRGACAIYLGTATPAGSSRSRTLPSCFGRARAVT